MVDPVRPAGSSPARAWPIALAVAIVLTTALTYPTVTRFGSAGRLDTNDGNFSIWNVAWVAHQVMSDPRHLFEANIFYPHPHTLTYSELNLVAGVLALPVYAMTGNGLAAINSAILIALALAFLAMWALVRHLTGSAAAGLVAATGYAFSAYTASHTAQVQLLMIFGFPLTLLAFHRLVAGPRFSTGLSLGGAVAATALACGYYGVYVGAVLGLATLWWAVRRPAYWMAIAVAAVVTAALVLPVFVPYSRSRAEEGAVRLTNVQELRDYSADWRAHLTSGTDLGSTWLAWLYAGDQKPKEVLFPGIVVTALAVAGLTVAQRDAAARRPVLMYGVIAVLACWATLGPDAGLYLWLTHVLPGMSLLRVPARLGVVDIFALSVLAGYGFSRIDRGRAWLAPVAIAALAAELWVPWPLHDLPPVARAYHLLAGLPRAGVVELPFPYEPNNLHQHAKPMLMSTFHWQPLVNGYSDYIPPDFSAIAAPLNQFPDPQSFEIMRARGVRYVIWKVDQYGPYREALLARIPSYQAHLRLITDDQGVRLYQIVSWPGTPPRP
jgi:hypothetical protein